MSDDFFTKLEKNSEKYNITEKEYNLKEDKYIDAIILSVILPLYGLLIYVIHIGRNKYLARKCLTASVISLTFILMLLYIFIDVFNI